MYPVESSIIFQSMIYYQRDLLTAAAYVPSHAAHLCHSQNWRLLVRGLTSRKSRETCSQVSTGHTLPTVDKSHHITSHHTTSHITIHRAVLLMKPSRCTSKYHLTLIIILMPFSYFIIILMSFSYFIIILMSFSVLEKILPLSTD